MPLVNDPKDYLVKIGLVAFYYFFCFIAIFNKGVFNMLTNERIKELNAKSAQLQEWEALAKEAAAEAEAIKDEIKAVMNEQATEEMTVDTHIVRWTTTLSNRFDTTTFKKEHNEMYKQYTKQTTSRRFSIT